MLHRWKQRAWSKVYQWDDLRSRLGFSEKGAKDLGLQLFSSTVFPAVLWRSWGFALLSYVSRPSVSDVTRNPSTALISCNSAWTSSFKRIHTSSFKKTRKILLGHVTCSDSSISKLTCHFLVLWHPIFWVPYNKHDDRLPISSMTQLWSETSGGSAASTGRPSESSRVVFWEEWLEEGALWMSSTIE